MREFCFFVFCAQAPKVQGAKLYYYSGFETFQVRGAKHGSNQELLFLPSFQFSAPVVCTIGVSGRVCAAAGSEARRRPAWHFPLQELRRQQRH